MKRQSVTVDDIILTREQVKRAVKLLAQPEPIEAGALVTYKNKSTVYLVLGERLAGILQAKYQVFGGSLSVRTTDGANTYTMDSKFIKRVGSLKTFTYPENPEDDKDNEWP